jgi:dihydroflavonol-4-reductase
MSKNTQTVLLSGISGFIGMHTAIQLLNKGYKVRGTVREKSKMDRVKTIIKSQASIDNLELIRCELMDSTDWKYAARDVDFIQHIASPLPKKQPKDRNILILPAREGVLNVLKAAQMNKIKRVVITSSIAAIGYGHANNNRTFTEADWTDVADKKDVNPYIESKTLAERAAWDFMKTESPSFELATINPSVVLGPQLDNIFSASTLLIKKILRGDMPGAPKIGFCIVDVRDVADLHIKAMESPNAAGKRFICSGEYIDILGIGKILKEAYPDKAKKVPGFVLPNILVKITGLFDKEVAGVLNELNVKREFDNSLARNILNWSPRPVEEAITATGQSIFDHGVLK